MFVQTLPIAATKWDLLATIDMCNILKSVLGLHKLACTDPDNVLDPQIGSFQLPTDRGGESAWREAVVAAVATIACRTMADIPGSVHFCPLVSRG